MFRIKIKSSSHKRVPCYFFLSYKCILSYFLLKRDILSSFFLSCTITKSQDFQFLQTLWQGKIFFQILFIHDIRPRIFLILVTIHMIYHFWPADGITTYCQYQISVSIFPRQNSNLEQCYQLYLFSNDRSGNTDLRVFNLRERKDTF